MRRVHDYTSSERPSSPDTSPSSGQGSRKRENSGRKRRVTGTSGAQTMKRTRSIHTQTNAIKASQTAGHHSQRLLTAKTNYYNCRSRLLQELGDISPKDSAMHEKVNASLQELITLGLNYRHVEASQAAVQISHGLPT
ncbi:C2H2 finger domain protein [Aspergillus sp. HF37]|nr:C2H2 finger domain protein [Aspergillus sp. HF37]